MIKEVRESISSNNVDIKKAVQAYKEPGLRGLNNLYKAHCTSCDKYFLSIEDCVRHFKDVHGGYKG